MISEYWTGAYCPLCMTASADEGFLQMVSFEEVSDDGLLDDVQEGEEDQGEWILVSDNEEENKDEAEEEAAEEYFDAVEKLE